MREEKEEGEEEAERERETKRRSLSLAHLSTLLPCLSASSRFLSFSSKQAGVSDVVAGALDGFNGTVLAYGQTGSGKTHTMIGEREVVSRKFCLKTRSC